MCLLMYNSVTKHGVICSMLLNIISIINYTAYIYWSTRSLFRAECFRQLSWAMFRFIDDMFDDFFYRVSTRGALSWKSDARSLVGTLRVGVWISYLVCMQYG